MEFRLILARPWTYRDHKRNHRTLPAGAYGVPDEVPMDIAERAVGQGVATMYRLQMPQQKPEKKRGRKRPPQNMARGVAPENKAAVH